MAAALQQAAREVAWVLNGQSLAQLPPDALCEPRLRDQVKDIVFGALRRYGEAQALLSPLLANPPYPETLALLYVALYRLQTRDDPHTVVNQAVEVAARASEGRYKGLVNGVLRNFLRRRAELERALLPASPATLWHPDWWLAKLRNAWPEDWQAIVAAGNRLPPMGLRVNLRRISLADYQQKLAATGLSGTAQSATALVLDTPAPIARLPGFSEGLVSVQDWGAQRAAELLDPAPNARVLDACAAPGGKSAHLLERQTITLTAQDIDPQRCRLIADNLARLGLSARVREGDAGVVSKGERFDAILADVPCSASGVVRRHPDIKWLRQPGDIDRFVRTQRRILDRLWNLLVPGGKLLYATCSVFPEENGKQIARFLQRTPEASLAREEHWLPDDLHDGFYYALLAKSS